MVSDNKYSRAGSTRCDLDRRLCNELLMTMRLIFPSTGGHDEAFNSFLSRSAHDYPASVLDCIVGPEAGLLQKLQKGYLDSTEDILAYFHTDVRCYEDDWDTRILAEFEDPTVGICGFGGGKRLGSPDIYKLPYKLQQLARYDFVSNLKDAEVHGRRNRNEEDIAVVDSFALIIRRSLLDSIVGWPIATYPAMHMSDAWACLVARRMRRRVRMVGISCTHKSGGVKGDGSFDYSAWQKEIGMTDQEMHTKSHRLIYDDFRDVLPVVTL